MSSRLPAFVASAGSALVLLGAFAFQYIGGLPPCEMCLWQRWPHVAAIVIGLLGLTFGIRFLFLLGGLAALTTAGIGVFHAGVEQGWWEGFTTCSSSADISGISATDLLDQLMAAPVVRCDEIPWQMLGLSMAGWNAVVSFALCVLWVRAWRNNR